MKSIKYSLALVLVMFAVSVGFSQEDTIVINHQEIGPHQRPLVRLTLKSIRPSLIVADAIMTMMNMEPIWEERGKPVPNVTGRIIQTLFLSQKSFIYSAKIVTPISSLRVRKVVPLCVANVT